MSVAIIAKLHESDFPPLGTGSKDRGPEDYSIPDLLRLVNSIPPRYLDHWISLACNTNNLAGMGSGNHVLLASANLYLHDPNREVNGSKAGLWWIQLSRWFLREDKPAPGDLGYLMSNEPRSNDYDGFSVGSMLAVLDCAITRGDTAVVDAMTKLVTAWCAFTALCCTSQGGNEVIAHTLAGVESYKNPSRTIQCLPTGARSTLAHLAADPGALLLDDIVGFGGSHAWEKRRNPDPFTLWWLQISGRRDGGKNEWQIPIEARTRILALLHNPGDTDAMDDVASLIPSTVRFVGDRGIEVRRWRDGTILGIMEKCVNGNTGYIPAALASPNQSMTVLYPWDKPKPNNPGSGRVIEKEGKIFVTSNLGEVEPVNIPLEPPGRIYRFCDRGVIEE